MYKTETRTFDRVSLCIKLERVRRRLNNTDPTKTGGGLRKRSSSPVPLLARVVLVLLKIGKHGGKDEIVTTTKRTYGSFMTKIYHSQVMMAIIKLSK